MNNLFRLTLLALFLSAGSLVAQSRVGHIDLDSLIRLMPKYDSVKKVSEEYGKKLDIEYQSMYADYDKKVKEYTEQEKNWTDFIKEMKKKDIIQLEQTLRDFPQNAQNEMAKKNAELLTPLEKAARKAIDDVAKENKYTLVLDSTVGNILYSQPSDDLMPLVKKKLGIK
ncbi:MAG: OmpH family outer membrane protein [Bacteroidia bacterium]|nr:OmpH family outer membrane protein [Bacteroidia bacterium]